MGKMSNIRVKDYLSDRIYSLDISDVLKKTVVDNGFYGKIDSRIFQSIMLVNPELLYREAICKGYNSGVANLLIFDNIEHELCHFINHKELHKMNNQSEVLYMLGKSYILADKYPLIKSTNEKNGLYHEYEADVFAMNSILNNQELLNRFTDDELYDYNNILANRISNWYRNEYPIKNFINLALKYGIIDEENYNKLLEYSLNSEEDRILVGKPLSENIERTISTLTEGTVFVKNILGYIKK